MPAQSDDDLLLAALQAAPRRHAMPALPALPHDADAAARLDPATRLATAMEAARAALESGAPVPEQARPVFVRALGDLIHEALDQDPTFQAQAWRRRHAVVEEWLQLTATTVNDARIVRAAVQAVAHPGKRRHEPARPVLDRLHLLASQGDWTGLADALHAEDARSDGLEDAVARIVRDATPALHRLGRAATLHDDPAVRHYRALCQARGPGAGTVEAGQAGRDAARVGDRAEAEALQALAALAALLDEQAGGRRRWQVLHGLSLPAGFPQPQPGAKDEWDLLLVRQAAPADEPAELMLLAEVKATPTAATTDLPRLIKGLQRLAAGAASGPWTFASRRARKALEGAALARFAPVDGRLPARVVYLCAAPPAQQPAPLAASARGRLLAHPACEALAVAAEAGGRFDIDTLQVVWADLLHRPAWRGVLAQHETSRRAREAMLHPRDLLEAAQALRSPPSPDAGAAGATRSPAKPQA